MQEQPPDLPEEFAVEIAAALAIPHPSDRLSVLEELIPYLPATQRAESVQEALKLIADHTMKEYRYLPLARLAPYIPEDCMADALAVARGFEPCYRDEVRQGLAPFLRQVLREASQVHNVPTTYLSLTELLSRLTKLSPDRIHPLWKSCFADRAAATRQDLCSMLAALAELLASLGGKDAVREAYSSLQEVRQWWP